MFRKLKAFWAGLHPRVSIGRGTRMALSTTIKPGKGRIAIGKDGVIGPYTMLMAYGGTIEIGDRVSINPFCILYGHGGLKIGSDVLIAAHVTVIPANHKFDRIDTVIRKQGESRKGIVIGDDVWIGTGARILDGITIGTGCVIAAGAVVKDDLPPYTVAAGVPARPIKKRG